MELLDLEKYTDIEVDYQYIEITPMDKLLESLATELFASYLNQILT